MSESSLVFLIPTKGLLGGLARLCEMIFIPRSYGIFYLTAKSLLRHCKKIVLITWLLSGNFYIFNMDSKRLLQFHFIVCSIMNMITAFSILLQLHGISLISLMNQKREQQTILNEILCDRRRTIRKIKMAKRENLNKKKRTCWYEGGRRDLWWEYFVSGVTPKVFWKKNFRVEEASFFDLVSHLRPYISANPNLPNRRALCADKKFTITLNYLKEA